MKDEAGGVKRVRVVVCKVWSWWCVKVRLVVCEDKVDNM
jgi:hypothetical protein